MLSTIYIKNFAIIDEKTIPFSEGFNVLSGETGAGKSILIDALGLQLGDRADSSWIRHGTQRCEIQSEYTFPADSRIHVWLDEHELNDEDSCQLRRTLSAGGKSKCYINGIPTTVGNTKRLGEMLVDIHGQHAHQSLTDPDKQLVLLDAFADNNSEALQTVKQCYRAWQALRKQQADLQQGENSLGDKHDLLRYQLAELEEAAVNDDEFTALAERQKRLSATGEIMQQAQAIQSALADNHGVTEQLGQLLQWGEKVSALDDNFSDVYELLNQALIYAEEAASSLNSYNASLELDPEALAETEQRMSRLHDLARKHHIEPSALGSLQAQLSEQLATIDSARKQLARIDQDIADAETAYQRAANALHQRRADAAVALTAAVHQQLSELSLENARFRVDFTQTAAKADGTDKITLMFAPNPGQGEKPLHKIASGGELSRISLAIQVASVAQKSDATLIFDEVDSGVGGATAEVIGRLLKTLSQYNQVICVTHLAQVAAFADRHLKITKQVIDETTFTDFHALDDAERIAELARMSGGIQTDKKTTEHAQNLRDNALQFSKTLT